MAIERVYSGNLHQVEIVREIRLRYVHCLVYFVLSAGISHDLLCVGFLHHVVFYTHHSYNAINTSTQYW
jgi:hypothetical protein